MGYDQQNIQQDLHVSLDGSAEVAAIAEARHGEIIARKDTQYQEQKRVILANPEAEFVRLGSELGKSNITVINQLLEWVLASKSLMKPLP